MLTIPTPPAPVTLSYSTTVVNIEPWGVLEFLLIRLSLILILENHSLLSFFCKDQNFLEFSSWERTLCSFLSPFTMEKHMGYIFQEWELK